MSVCVTALLGIIFMPHWSLSFSSNVLPFNFCSRHYIIATYVLHVHYMHVTKQLRTVFRIKLIKYFSFMNFALDERIVESVETPHFTFFCTIKPSRHVTREASPRGSLIDRLTHALTATVVVEL